MISQTGFGTVIGIIHGINRTMNHWWGWGNPPARYLFDPGSERTLAAGFRHASRGRKPSGE